MSLDALKIAELRREFSGVQARFSVEKLTAVGYETK
jgi:hypothetical protein